MLRHSRSHLLRCCLATAAKAFARALAALLLL